MAKLRHLFLVKVIIMPIFGFTLFGWAVGKAHGFGPVFKKETHIVSGVPVGVVFFTAMSSAIAPKATIALNSTSLPSALADVSCGLHSICQKPTRGGMDQYSFSYNVSRTSPNITDR
jgi:hypothetical protein